MSSSTNAVLTHQLNGQLQQLASWSNNLESARGTRAQARDRLVGLIQGRRERVLEQGGPSPWRRREVLRRADAQLLQAASQFERAVDAAREWIARTLTTPGARLAAAELDAAIVAGQISVAEARAELTTDAQLLSWAESRDGLVGGIAQLKSREAALVEELEAVRAQIQRSEEQLLELEATRVSVIIEEAGGLDVA